MSSGRICRLTSASACLLLLSCGCLFHATALSQDARVVIRADQAQGEVSPYIYSSVVRWDLAKGLALPDNATPEDFYELKHWVEGLNLSMLRYPGGTVADGFYWKESIGPLKERPLGTITALDMDRHDPIVVGLDEFLHFCELVGAEPLIVVNFGNGSPEEAAELVEYLNAPADGSNPGGGTDWAQRRAGNGHPRPYGVKFFEIGNEIYLMKGRKKSFKEFGHTDVRNYAGGLVRFAKAMREIDPQIKIGCPVISPGEVGSTDRFAKTKRPWNRTLFEIAGGEIDFVCPHLYGPGEQGKEYQPSVEAFVKKSFAHIEGRRQELGELRAEMRQASNRELEVFVTEYNMSPSTLDLLSGLYIAEFLSTAIESGIQAAMFHNIFGFGGDFPALNFVKAHNLRVPRPTYLALKMLSGRVRGTRLETEVECATFTSGFYPDLKVPYLTAVAVKREETLVLEVINKDISRDYRTEIELVGGQFPASIRVFELNAPDLKTNNERDLNPDRTTVRLEEKTVEAGGRKLTYTFPAHSVTLLEF